MFKKDTGIKSLSNVKNSEKKKIYHTIIQEYKIDEKLVTPEIATAILPNNIKHSTFKTVTGYKGTVYTDEAGTPLWFRTRDSQMMPTVFTLWKAPFLLPIIYTHDFVIERLLNGSNLMVPGTLPPFDKRLTRGTLCAVANISNPKVLIAVGRCGVDMFRLTEVVGLNGIAVEVLQVIDDELYKSAGKKVKVPVNEEIQLPLELSDLAGIEQDKIDTEKEQNNPLNEESTPEDQTTQNKQKFPSCEFLEKEVAELNISTDDSYSLKTEDIDDFFIRSVIYSITQDKIELPISASNFVADHVLKNLPPVDPNQVNMKKTSWKKSAKFLKAMEKQQLVKVKGKDDNLTVLKLADKTHEKLAHFEPYKIGKKATSKSTNDSDNKDKLIVLQLYKPNPSSRMLFNKLDMDFTNFYELHDIKKMITKYIQLGNLPDPKNKKFIKIDSVLDPMLKQKQTTIERSKVVDLVVNKGFAEYYKVLDSMENFRNVKAKKGKIPKIKVTVEQLKFGRKIITKIVGLEDYYIDPQEISAILKVKCSGSSTITPTVSNPKVVEVTVQGPHDKIVEDTLVSEYGLKSSWIDFQNKVKPKKKKKPTPSA